MVGSATGALRRLRRNASLDPSAILNALPFPLLIVDSDYAIRLVNIEAQQFFDASDSALIGRELTALLPADSPVFQLIDMVLARSASLSDYGVDLESPRIGRHVVTLTAAPFGDGNDRVVLSFHLISMARHIEHQLTHRGAARSVSAMASMLAHEVKNPLSGIRGAAQLLEQTAADQDRELTRLICDEADRIVSMVNRMEVFTDEAVPERAAVNIHTVLDRVRKLAQNGFARPIRFVERYDPSLPPVLANHDQLVQVFLNLVKNAAEAAPGEGGEIVLTTSYQRGVSIALPGTGARVHLPIAVTVADNGEGVAEELRDHLFDPFVTTKQNGSGLGLALVAKIVGDHGGFVGFEERPHGTAFKVSLPMASELPAQNHFREGA
ncbi:MAG: ATP-binding protein [Pseudomonadota bacterium]